MEKKIRLTICCGTYCHIMGGAELQLLGDIIPEPIMKHVDFRYSTCMGNCKGENSKPPYAEINGVLIPQATPEKIIVKLKELLGGTTDVCE